MRRTRRRKSQKHALSEIMGLLCAELHVGILKHMQFQEFWDSCAQNKTSEISKTCTFRNSWTLVRRTTRRNSQKHVLSGIVGLLCAEQDVGNIKNGLSGILGLLCAEQDVGNLNKWTFRIFWDSCALNKTSEISKNALSGIQVTKTHSVAWGRTFLGGIPPLGTTF